MVPFVRGGSVLFLALVLSVLLEHVAHAFLPLPNCVLVRRRRGKVCPNSTRLNGTIFSFHALPALANFYMSTTLCVRSSSSIPLLWGAFPSGRPPDSPVFDPATPS